MPQNIYVMGANIHVLVIPKFNPDIAPWTAREFPFDTDYYSTLELGNKPWKTNLKIEVIIMFPPMVLTIDGQKIASIPYQETWSCSFTNITHNDGKLDFSDIGPLKFNLMSRINALPDNSPEKYLYRLLDGSAVVSASNNPKIPVIKIKLVLGSSDVFVTDMRVESKNAEWKTSTEFGKGGGKSDNGGNEPNREGILDYIWDFVTWGPKKVLDVVRDVEFKVSYETSGGGGSRQTGLSRTYGKLSEQPEWTLSLELPEPKPNPQPIQPIPASTAHKVYFLTGKKDLIGPNNIPNKFPNNKDQIQSLKEFMNGIKGKFGYKNISKIECVGHASGLGDSAGNLTLGNQRAIYVKEKLIELNSEIPVGIISSEGAPLGKSNKDDDPNDRRVEINVHIKNKDVRMP